MSNSRAEALTAARARKKRGPGGVERNVVLHRHAGARGRFQDGTPAAARGYTLSERFAGRDRRITPSGLKAGNGEGVPLTGGTPSPASEQLTWTGRHGQCVLRHTRSERFAGRDRQITPSGLKAGNGEGEPPHGGGPLPGQRATHLTRAGRK